MLLVTKASEKLDYCCEERLDDKSPQRDDVAMSTQVKRSLAKLNACKGWEKFDRGN